jgi:hypothetical protein
VAGDKELQVQDQPWLHSELQISIDYMSRFCFKKKKRERERETKERFTTTKGIMRKNKDGNTMFHNFKIYYKIAVIKAI